MSSEIVDRIIQSCIASQYVYSKVHFDNAKDSNALMYAAKESAEMLQQAVEFKLERRLEELLIERIEKVRGDGKWVVKVGETLYRIEEY